MTMKAKIVENKLTLSRRIAQKITGEGDVVSHQTVLRTLEEVGMKPYKPRLLQALHEDDGDRRQEFCELMLEKFNPEPDSIDKIIWSDKAMFKLNGHINRHNSIYWSDVNPKVVMQHELNLPGVTVWCGISSAGIIGPYFFENTVTGNSYVDMLQNWLLPQLYNTHQQWFQQDGAAAHYSNVDKNWLNENFTNLWIGRPGT